MITWQLVNWKDVSVGTEYMIFRNETLFNLIHFQRLTIFYFKLLITLNKFLFVEIFFLRIFEMLLHFQIFIFFLRFNW